MSMILGWRRRPNAGLALALVGLAGIVQSFVVLHAQTVLEVNGVYLLILIPLGVSITLGGVEMSLAEAIYTRFSVRERKDSRWKKSEHRGLPAVLGKLEIASILSAFLVLVLSLVFYFSIVAACQGTSIPYYARFALAEVVSALVIVTLSFIVGRMVGSKRRSSFSM